MAKGLTYGQWVGATMDCPRADFRDCIAGAPLTPLQHVVAPHLATLPGDISEQLTRDFWKRHGESSDWAGKHEAQAWLQTEVEEFRREKLDIAFDDYEIRTRAARWSRLCGKMMCLEVMQDFARSVGVVAPEVGKHITRDSAAKRLQCEIWWRRAMRRAYTRKAESHMVAAGFVHRHRQVYASDRCVEYRTARKRADQQLLQSMVAVADTGEQLELWDVVQASQANPTLRRNELMKRLAGFEEVAQQQGHVAEFITLTTPSAFHRTLSNGSKNPRWEGFTPREGQAWLSKMWARARSKLQRISVLFYGFRVAEPHHDGTPHWHMVLFVSVAEAEALRRVLAGVMLSDYASEAGALLYRYKFKRIDPAKGSAAGYLAKYIAKNIDGFQVGADHETEGKDAAESVDRVAAWASAHHIRQFQQIGGPAVSLWRELRRIRLPVVDNATVEAARKAASDESSWSEFINATGGIRVGRKTSVQLRVEHTGELSQYGELKGEEIVGVQSACGVVRTREKVWRIQRKSAVGSGSDKGRASYTVPVESGSSPAGSKYRIHAGGGCSIPVESAGQGGGMAYECNVIAVSVPAPLSSLGPVSITVRGRTSRGIEGEGEAWHPTQ